MFLVFMPFHVEIVKSDFEIQQNYYRYFNPEYSKYLWNIYPIATFSTKIRAKIMLHKVPLKIKHSCYAFPNNMDFRNIIQENNEQMFRCLVRNLWLIVKWTALASTSIEKSCALITLMYIHISVYAICSL